MSLDQLLPPLNEPADGRIALNAALLKSLRKARGLSQEAVAELCASRQLPVSIASIKRAETGKVVLYRTARHLAALFEIELDALVEAPAGTAAAPPAPQPEPSLRYVIELHIALASAASADSAPLQEIAAVVSQAGGLLDSAAGAHAVAVFGLPQAYGSDAERCMRCALTLARVLLVHGGQALAMRLVRWEDGRASPGGMAAPDLGSAGAAAHQLAQGPLAIPIYVARNLAGQLEGRFAFDSSQRYPGYLQYAAEQASAAGQPALVGRHAETRQFQAVAEATLAARDGHIVYLRAMAGVGKTRLAAHFADSARGLGFATHRCEVQDAGADSWRAPLEQLARSLFGLGAGADPAAEQAIEDAAGALALPAEWSIFYRAATGARMTSEQLSLYAAMSHAVRDQGIGQALQLLILRMAARQPLLLALEDVHWGEPYLFEALGALMAATREAPVIWVLTSRIEHDPLDAALRAHLFEVALTVLDLAPLAARDAQALAAQFGEVDPAYRQRCVERALGNPLFLTQLLASPEHDLPDSLKHLIQTRVDALAPLQRRALRTASVIGNRFELAVLREAMGEPDYEPEAAGRNSLVRRLGPGSYAFVHDLVMHCIYESIDAGQQRRLHRTVAALFRERDPAQAAQHLYRADDPSAFEMMLHAIRDKLAAHQYQDALELTAQCSANDSTRYSSFALALLKAHAIAGLGQMQEAKQSYEHALMLAGRAQEKIDAVLGLAGTLNVLEQLDEEERLLDDTLPLAHSVKAEASLAKLLYLKGNIYFPRGNYSECRRHHEQAVRYAQASKSTETEARALSGMADSYYAQGRMRKAYEVFSQCIGMCGEHRYINIEASNRAALGSTRIYLGQPDQAADDALRSAELARKVGNRRAEIFARMTAGWVLVATGALPQAAAEVANALDLARSMGAARFEPFLMESQARIAWLGGDLALAERRIGAAADLMERLALQRFLGPWVLGTLALFTSDPAVRKRALLKGASHLTRDCLAHNGYRFFVTAAEVSLLEGDLVAAQFYAEQLAEYAAPEPCAWIGHHVALIGAYAGWLAAPSDRLRNELVQLRADALRYGFAQASPRLFTALEVL